MSIFVELRVFFFSIEGVSATNHVVRIHHPEHGLSNSPSINRITVFIFSASLAHSTKAKITSSLIQKSSYSAPELKEPSMVIPSISKCLFYYSIYFHPVVFD